MEIPSGQGNSVLAPNILSLIAYLLAPFTGIVVLVLERDNKEVQFHAWQAMLFGGGYIALVIALEIVSALLGAIASFLGVMIGLLIPLVMITAFVVWLCCLAKAYRGERWKIPYLGDVAARRAGLE